MNDHSTKFTTAPISSLVMKMAIPSALSMLVMIVYSTTDTYFVSKLGTDATAALGLALSFVNIVQALGLLFGHGSGNYISRMEGKDDRSESSRMASTGVLVAFSAGVLLAVISFLSIDWLTTFLGASKPLHALTKEYLQIVLFGSPFIIASLTINNQLRLQGKAAIGTIGIFAGAILNCILDPICIFVAGLGISGAAYATVIGQILGFILLLILSMRKDCVHYKLKDITFSKNILKELFTGGIPNFSREILIALSLIVLNNILKTYGEAYVASFSIVNKIIIAGTYLMVGVGHGFQPVCGINYGAGKNDRVKDSFKLTVKIALIMMIVISLVFILFSQQFIIIFSRTVSVIEVGSRILRVYALTLPLVGYITIAGMFLQNTHRFRAATLLTTARQGYVFIPVVFLLSVLFGGAGTLLAQPVSDIISFCFALLLIRKRTKQLEQKG